MLLSNCHQFLSLCTEHEILYGHITCVDVSACVDMNKCWDKLDEASVTQAVHSLFYSYSPEWRQHFEKRTILVYLRVSFKQHNDCKWAKIVSYLIYLFRIFQGQIAILWKFSQRSLENFTRSQKNKTVTFNDCILGIYGSNIKDFNGLPHAFPLRWFNPTFACPWRAKHVFFKFRVYFLQK